MNLESTIFEVEFRCHFNNIDEAYQALPFLHPSLQRRSIWNTTIYGLNLFRSGQLLRTAKVELDKQTRYFIGWKGLDTGKFANIRQELDEEITSATTGSRILRSLGGRADLDNIEDVVRELERSGYPRFMSFEGTDLSGYFKPYDVSLKLMTCAKLKWPLMVEIEKIANSVEEAACCEQALFELCGRLGLQDRIVKEEPPTLLYNAIYG